MEQNLTTGKYDASAALRPTFAGQLRPEPGSHVRLIPGSAALQGMEHLHPADIRLLHLVNLLSLQVDVFRAEGTPVWLAVTKQGAATCWGAGMATHDAVCCCLGEVAEHSAIAIHLARQVHPTLGDEATSSGCAAHRDLPSARLAALLERIERDATAIWWHARCRRPALRIVGRPDAELQALLRWRDRSSRASWLLDLTHDLGVPVVAAISLEHDRLPALGVAARPWIGAAARAALLELAQAEMGLALQCNRWTDVPASLRKWLEAPSEADLAVLRPNGERTCRLETPSGPQDSDMQWNTLLAQLGSAGLHASWLDISRPDLSVPVARVVVPGLCDDRPASWRPRLLEVPIRLGWRDAGFCERDLNGAPLLI